MLILPELSLAVASLTFFVLSLTKTDQRLMNNSAVFLGILAVLAACVALPRTGLLFGNGYAVDAFSQIFKLFITLGLAAVLIFGQDLKDINHEVRPEYYCFLFLSGLGLTMLVSSIELLAIFVSLELSSFALYVLVPLRDDRSGLRVQMEAGIKYILFGVTATGFMLFGMSYLFGLSGSTYLPEIMNTMRVLGPQPAVIFAVAMVLVGFLYKLAIVPFHFWVPDVYQGAANETTSFVGTVPKLGAVALLIRIVQLAAPDNQTLVTLLATLAVCSMFYGNLCALVQKDIKRLLGFSGIAHGGFVLLGLLTLEPLGYATSMYYIFGYVIMSLACFLVLCKLSINGENVTVDDLSGLHRREPLLALTLTIGLFALAGIPPFVGFMGKFLLLTGALAQGHITLVVLAAINTAIAIYYYLAMVKVAYTTDEGERPAVQVDGLTRALSVGLIVAMILMGVMPSRFVGWAEAAVAALR